MKSSAYYSIKDFYPHLKSPHKFVGRRPITLRSGWEITYAKWLDSNPSIVAWKSEDVVISYYYPVDQRNHRYFVDFWMKVKQEDGSFKEYLIEIKPAAQTREPKLPKKMSRRYIEAVNEYIKNQSKWEAAKRYCLNESQLGRNIEFVVLTEHDLPV